MIALLVASSLAFADPCSYEIDGYADGTVAPFLYDGALGRAHPFTFLRNSAVGWCLGPN